MSVQVRPHASTAKFLIFSKSTLTLLYITEALAVMGVQNKVLSLQPVKATEQDIMTFESSVIFRVFLMELRHGSRGLYVPHALEPKSSETLSRLQESHFSLEGYIL